jgi:hypothetical protein
MTSFTTARVLSVVVTLVSVTQAFTTFQSSSGVRTTMAPTYNHQHSPVYAQPQLFTATTLFSYVFGNNTRRDYPHWYFSHSFFLFNYIYILIIYIQ